MKKLVRLELVLENCEVIEVNISRIFKIITGEIKSSLHIQDIDVYEMFYTDYMLLRLKKANNTFFFTNEAVPGEKTAIQRLKCHKDITNIEFHFDDNTSIEVGVPWKGNDNYKPNKAEKWIETDDYYIISFEKSTLKTFFFKVFNYLNKRKRCWFQKKRHKIK